MSTQPAALPEFDFNPNKEFSKKKEKQTPESVAFDPQLESLFEAMKNDDIEAIKTLKETMVAEIKTSAETSITETDTLSRKIQSPIAELIANNADYKAAGDVLLSLEKDFSAQFQDIFNELGINDLIDPPETPSEDEIDSAFDSIEAPVELTEIDNEASENIFADLNVDELTETLVAPEDPDSLEIVEEEPIIELTESVDEYNLDELGDGSDVELMSGSAETETLLRDVLEDTAEQANKEDKNRKIRNLLSAIERQRQERENIVFALVQETLKSLPENREALKELIRAQNLSSEEIFTAIKNTSDVKDRQLLMRGSSLPVVESGNRAIPIEEVQKNLEPDYDSGEVSLTETLRHDFISKNIERLTNPENTKEKLEEYKTLEAGFSDTLKNHLQEQLDNAQSTDERVLILSNINRESTLSETRLKMSSDVVGSELLDPEESGKNRTMRVRHKDSEFPSAYKSAIGEDSLRRSGFEQGTGVDREWLVSLWDRALGTNLVPAVTLTNSGPDGWGSYQQWIPVEILAGKTDWKENSSDESFKRLAFLDASTGQTDRNAKNIARGFNGELAGIDNSFGLATSHQDKVDRLGSFALEHVKDQSIPDNLKSQGSEFLQNAQLLNTLKEAHILMLGDKGEAVFNETIQNIEKLTEENAVFPESEIKWATPDEYIDKN